MSECKQAIEKLLTKIVQLEQRLAAANGRLEEYEEKTCNCRWEGETLVRQCELHEAHVDAIHEWADRAKVAEQRLAEAEAKNIELEKELFIFASDVMRFIGFGINAGLLDKAKRIYTRLLKGFGESERGSDDKRL